MSLPTAAQVLSLDYVGWSLPQANVDASSNVQSLKLDIVGWSLPKIAQATGTAPDLPNVVYVKTGASTWSTATAIYVKTAASTWNVINQFNIKTSSGWNGTGDTLYDGVTWNPPVFQSAATNSSGTKIILTYNEALSSTTAAASAFAVLVNSSSATISSVGISGSTVELTMQSTINNGQTITVAYTDPSGSDDTNAIQDQDGNDAASFSATSVTNNSATYALLTSNVVLHLDANAYSGSGNWLDTSGNNKHGTISNADHIKSGDRDYFVFNPHDREGGGHYITLASGAVDPNSSFTISFWVRINAVNNNINTYLSNLAADSGLQLRDNTTGIEVVKSFSAAIGTFSNSVLPDDKIYNIVFVRDNSTNPDTFKVFVDGGQTNPDTTNTLGTFTTTETSFVTPIILGRNYSNVSNDNESLNGRLYHVLAYSTALTSAQILNNYNALKDRYSNDDICPLVTENLELYLNAGIASSGPFSSTGLIAQNSTWNDLSGQGNNFGFGFGSDTSQRPIYATGDMSIVRPTSISSTTTAMVYIASHTDLIGAFGNNTSSAISHYTDYGYSEGRGFTFDVAAYLELQADLRNHSTTDFYANHLATAQHFVDYGYPVETRSHTVHANIDQSKITDGQVDINAGNGHARSALNADFFKFGKTTDFTIGVWFYLDSVGDGDGIISCGANDHGGSYMLRITNTSTYPNVIEWYRNRAYSTSNVFTALRTSNNSISADSNWHYVLISCDRDSFTKIYIDGFRKANSTSVDYRSDNIGTLSETGSENNTVSATDVDNVFRVGANTAENNNLNGRIAQVHLWKGRALDEREVLEAYNNTKKKFGHPQNLYRGG